jgi:hypothetical protein
MMVEIRLLWSIKEIQTRIFYVCKTHSSNISCVTAKYETMWNNSESNTM